MGIPAPFAVDASGLPPAGDQANAVLSGQITAIGPTAPFAFRGPMNLALYASINTALTTTAGSNAATVASGTGLAVGNAINSVNVPQGTTIKTLAGTNLTLAFPPLTIYGNTQSGAAQITNLGQTAGLLGATVTGPGVPVGTTVTGIPQPAIPPVGPGTTGTPGILALSNPISSSPVDGHAQPFVFAPTGNIIQTTGADANAIFTGGLIAWTGTVQIERSFDGGSTFIVCNIGANGALAQWTAGPVSLTFGEPEKQVLYRLNCIAYSSGVINYRISQTGGAAESLAIGPLSGG